jgi:hypothetical protein
VEFEFSWMTYFLALFALMACSIALTALCPGAGKRDDNMARRSGADMSPPAEDPAHAPGPAVNSRERRGHSRNSSPT